MSQNSSEIIITTDSVEKPPFRYKWVMLLLLPAWVFLGFITSGVIVTLVFRLLVTLNIPIASMNQTILNTVFAAFVYLMTLGIVIFIPLLIRKSRINKSDIGLDRWPQWSDIFLSPAGFVVYVILSSALIMLATRILPWFNPDQAQNTGFEHLVQNYEYILAFITLVIVAPVAEEILFRGYLFGKLKQYVPVWVAILATSLLFGAVHGAWDVAVDTFALSIILCYLRQTTGSIWSSVLLHMLKNGIAFYLLFIFPSLLA